VPSPARSDGSLRPWFVSIVVIACAASLVAASCTGSPGGGPHRAKAAEAADGRHADAQDADDARSGGTGEASCASGGEADGGDAGAGALSAPEQAGGGRSSEGEACDADRIVRTGLAPRTGPLRPAPARGWVGERLFGRGNDWEPNVATDPGAPYVYMETTRYTGHNPIPHISLRISRDGGRRFGATRNICVCRGGPGQYDPQIAVAANNGWVYAAWINGNKIVVTRSVDHGRTWSNPKNVSRSVGWGDHPWIAVGPSGQKVYVAFNHANSWVTGSHDHGKTWSKPVRTNARPRFHYAGGGYVAPGGDVTFVQSNYPVKGRKGAIRTVSTWSTDNGATWHTTRIDTVQLQPNCTNPGCPSNHLGGHIMVGADANGELVTAYDGAVHRQGPQYVYVQRSSDAGATWGHKRRVSPGGRDVAAFPAIVGTGNGDFRLWYMDDRNGSERWNTWYRRSTDGGRSWSRDLRISDARGGTGYKHPRGFDADYGDYGGIAVSSTGATFAVWAEGFGYKGPGGTWYNRTRA
jgi:hypothetical protein